MDYIANIEHQKLLMSKNPIVVNVDPAILPAGESRVDLRYYVDIKIQNAFQSSTFINLPAQEASERPVPQGFTSSPGAFFEIQTRIDDQLQTTPPVYGEHKITICPDAVRQYYYSVEKWNDQTLLESYNSTTMWAIRAQLAMRHYSMYKENFFSGDTECLSCKGKFLTWQPDGKFIRTDQPEFLDFLTNFTPSPTQLKVRVRVLYSDNSRQTYTALTAEHVTPMTVFRIPSGYSLVSFYEKTDLQILSYELWISNQDTRRVSEIRTFKIDRTYYESVRYLLFLNSLGGYDTLRCVGSPSESVSVQRQIVERFVDYDYLPTVSEMVINAVSGQRQVSINVGNWLSEQHREYLEDLLLSEAYYIVDDQEFIPLTPGFSSLVTKSITEWPIERTLSFTYANSIGGFSRLPKITPVQRATGWAQYTVSCELNANGIRTGRQIVNELVKYYLDSGERVKPIVTKANIAGADGYIEPWLSDVCSVASTPYKNMEISGPSKLKRSTCTDGKIGTMWMIVIAAGAYGSEISQADAQAKALAAWQAQDTQARADQFGSCILPVNMFVGLINNCPGDLNGKWGNDYNPIAAVLVDEAQLITNTVFTNGVARKSDVAYPARKCHYDVRCIFSGTPSRAYRIKLPAKNLVSPVFEGPATYRFANIETSWGDADLVFLVEPA